MDIVKGYKRTEVGLIPEEWKIHKVKDLIDLLTDYDANGSFESVAQNVNVYDHEEYAWYVRSTDLENNSKLDKVRYVDESSYKFLKKTSLNGGELLFLKRGDIGNVYLFEMKTHRATVAPNLYLLKLNQISDSKYLFYYFISNYGQRQLKSKNASSTLGALYKDDVKSILVPLPPTIAEQTAIATALSNIDELISQTEKLIEKKKAIKQGVMQELLKPKEGWETKRISEVCWFQEGPGVRKHQFTQSGVKLLNGTNIQEGKLDLENTDKFISEAEAFGWYSHFLVDENDILIACSGVSIDKFHEKVTVAKVFHLPLCMNTSTMRFKVKKGYLDQGYFIQFLKSKRFKEQISGKATGSAQLNFGPSHVTMVEIDLPSVEIQNKIGQVLSDMEMEIGIFELKLKKLSLQKQGMMQTLLTGKIRLL
jgi:type I restriction enzyme S subunit